MWNEKRPDAQDALQQKQGRNFTLSGKARVRMERAFPGSSISQSQLPFRDNWDTEGMIVSEIGH